MMSNLYANVEYQESGNDYGGALTAKSVTLSKGGEPTGPEGIRINIEGSGFLKSVRLILAPEVFDAIQLGVEALLGSDAITEVHLTLDEEEITDGPLGNGMHHPDQERLTFATQLAVTPNVLGSRAAAPPFVYTNVR